ncbi:MAG: hypothetical protein Q9209_007088 [Squamulea sp. 1 TL-2023]
MTVKDKSTEETSTQDTLTYDINKLKHNHLKLTITLNLLQPLTYPDLRSCLTGAHKRAKLWDLKILTPDIYHCYLDEKTNLQFGISGDLLWGVNQLYWGDVVDILFGLTQWTNDREKHKQKGVEFSFTVSEEDVDDGSGKKSKVELATGYLTRKAEYLDHGQIGPEGPARNKCQFGVDGPLRYNGYIGVEVRADGDAFQELFGIKQVNAE